MMYTLYIIDVLYWFPNRQPHNILQSPTDSSFGRFHIHVIRPKYTKSDKIDTNIAYGFFT